MNQLQKHEIYVDNKMIQQYEEQEVKYSLPKDQVYHSLKTILHESKKFLRILQGFITNGIHSFTEQRQFALTCKQAIYVDYSFYLL